MQKDLKTKAPKAGMTGQYNEFWGKIKFTIQKEWVKYRANTNNEASVQIIIDKFGKFSYNIVSLSYNEQFNKKVRGFLDILKSLEFPPAKDNVTSTMLLTLRDQID